MLFAAGVTARRKEAHCSDGCLYEGRKLTWLFPYSFSTYFFLVFIIYAFRFSPFVYTVKNLIPLCIPFLHTPSPVYLFILQSYFRLRVKPRESAQIPAADLVNGSRVVARRPSPRVIPSSIVRGGGHAPMPRDNPVWGQIRPSSLGRSMSRGFSARQQQRRLTLTAYH